MNTEIATPTKKMLLPPSVPGMPILGNLISFQKDVENFLIDSYKKMGPIFSLRFGPKQIAVLIGKEHNDFFFSMTDKLLSIKEVYRWMIPVFGNDNYTLAASKEKYQAQRHTSLAFFRANRIPNYFSAMVKETNEWVNCLGSQGQFELCHTLGILLMRIAASAFVGEEFRTYMGDEFRMQFEILAAGVDYLLPSNLPLPRFIRRNAARRKLHQMITAYIDRRKTTGSKDDNLQFMMEYKDDNGQALSSTTIVDIILKLVFAGHETTQSQLSWALIQLLQYPEYINKIRLEQAELFQNDNTLSIDKLKSMDKLEWALKETERMRPISLALLRHNTNDYVRGNYHIPKGWLTMISPLITHRLPQIFPNPDKYDPERFSPARDPDHSAINSLCGFGGGSHKCLGINFAYMNMKVILTILLKHYHLELMNHNPQPKKGLVYQPQPPIMVRYSRRT